MNVAVTGASGFIGTALVRALAARGDRVVATDRYAPAVPLPVTNFVRADLGDRDAMGRAVGDAEVVFHAAAVSSIARAAAAEYQRVNVHGTDIILALARASGARKVVHISSSTVYGAPHAIPIREDDPLAPGCPYSRSKARAEAVCRRHVAGGLDVTIIRPRVVVGPGRAGIFALVFAFIARGLPLPLPGGGRNLFQFTAAADLVRACLRAAARRHPGELAVYNIGSEVERPLASDLAALIAHAGSRSVIVPLPIGASAFALGALYHLGVGPLVPEQIRIIAKDFVLDTRRARAELGWRPQHDNADGLLTAWSWWREHVGRLSLRDMARWWRPRHQNLLQRRS